MGQNIFKYSTAAFFLGTVANSQENLELIGVPKQSGTGFQPAVTELARDLQWLDGMLLIIITVISLFVTFLLVEFLGEFHL